MIFQQHYRFFCFIIGSTVRQKIFNVLLKKIFFKTNHLKEQLSAEIDSLFLILHWALLF